MDVQNKRVLVVGLARSGLAVARALARRGAVVTVSDSKPPSEFRDVLPELLKDKIGVELGSQREETFLRNQIIVTSPGVPWDLPQLEAARKRNISIYPEVEVASWFLDGPLVGITGSNGKTTTTSLLGDMLKASGFPTFVGGNIGNALSSAVDNATPGTRFVTELSSFQLEGIHNFRPHVAVLLNLSPNHLDRHPNLEAYAHAKQQIFRNQGGQDFAVLNADDPWVAGLKPTVSSQPVFFSRTRELPMGVFASGGKIYYRVRHLERVLFETRDVTLKGDFNLEDVLAATTAACLLGADFAAIRKAVREFKAVEHRLEFVREIRGVDFYNNSKATSVDAAVKSVAAFDSGVHLIMGGKDKGAPYTPLIPPIRERARDVLLIGAAAPIIAEQLKGAAELLPAGDLETAVYEAFARARPGDTVLLAPACSSFDQFHDYEERGRIFKDLVKKLASDYSAGRTGRPKLASLFGVTTVPVEAPTPVETSIAESRPKPTVVTPEVVQTPSVKVESPAPEAKLIVAPSPVPAEAPVAMVEATAVPTPVQLEKSPAEKRSAARKRAREMASERGWKIGESAPAKNKPAETRATPRIVDLTPAPVPSEVEKPKTPTDAVVAEEPPLSIISLDPVPAIASPVEPVANPALAKPESPALERIEPSASVVPAHRTAEPLIHSAEPSIVEAAQSAEEADEPMSLRSARPTPSERKKTSARQPVEKGNPTPASRRVELSYVYEVGAVELPAVDSQAVAEDEPIIQVSAGTAEVNDDEVMPFESRPVKRKAEVRSLKSGGEEAGPADQPAPKQPKLFKGSGE